MNIESEDQQRASKNLASTGVAGEDDDVLIPGSAPPLSPGRTDVNPDDQSGVDELPGNEPEAPLDGVDDTLIDHETPDIDVDNAEMDDTPNPR